MSTSTRPRYPSDLTDFQWANIEHLFPHGDGRLGRPRSYSQREIVNAILSLAKGGCTRRVLPHDFPPWKTDSYYFYTWRDAGTWEKVHSTLRDEIREAAGKQPTPSLAIIDSQSVKNTEAGGPKGYDGGKKIGGRKRQMLVDTMGADLGPGCPGGLADRLGRGNRGVRPDPDRKRSRKAIGLQGGMRVGSRSDLGRLLRGRKTSTSPPGGPSPPGR